MRAISDSSNLVLAIAEAKGTGATGIKLYANLSAQLAAKIIAEAKRQGMKAWGHAWLNEAKPSDLAKAGINCFSHAPLLIYDNYDSIPSSWKKPNHDNKFWDNVTIINNHLFQLMKENNVILDATLLTYKQLSVEDSTRKYRYENGKRFTIAAYKAGIKICTGTDDDQVKFVQDEMKLLVSEAGFSNIDAIIAATKMGAEAIGIENTHGTIEINKIADLVVLNKNPLEVIDNINAVFLVIKEGKIFKKENTDQ